MDVQFSDETIEFLTWLIDNDRKMRGNEQMKIQHCGDLRTHKPHTYWGPSQKKGETKQEQYKCPGTK